LAYGALEEDDPVTCETLDLPRKFR
jgi:hypothetical protein